MQTYGALAEEDPPLVIEADTAPPARGRRLVVALAAAFARRRCGGVEWVTVTRR